MTEERNYKISKENQFTNYNNNKITQQSKFHSYTRNVIIIHQETPISLETTRIEMKTSTPTDSIIPIVREYNTIHKEKK